MDFYTQPKDMVIVRCAIDRADYDALKEFLRAQPIVAELSFSASTADSAPDFTAIVQAIIHSNIVIHLTKEAMALGDAAAKAAAGYAVNAWIDSRNARHQKGIESGKEEPILFDQYGHNIRVKKKK
jgi:hypothetical protein